MVFQNLTQILKILLKIRQHKKPQWVKVVFILDLDITWLVTTFFVFGYWKFQLITTLVLPMINFFVLLFTLTYIYKIQTKL